MVDRTPIFEMHILPMFRQLDRVHMLRKNPNLDLWSYDSVKANAGEILKRAGGDKPTMPTAGSGGMWPSEWRALFARWVAGGCRRLSVGIGRNYKLAPFIGINYRLTCTVAVPNAPAADSLAWFEIVDPGPGTATYRLVVFDGETFPPATETIDVDAAETIDPTSASNGVTVIDAAGPHRITAVTV